MADFEHPMGGWDMKKMSDALTATMELVAEQALVIEAMKVQIREMAFIEPPLQNVTFLPRNRRGSP